MKINSLKLFYFYIAFCFCCEALADSDQKQKQSEALKTYSFRPLLIQGKKRLIQQTKEMKVKTDNILETQIFFVTTDFKKRIFSDEGLEE
ncbi:MAG: hypothetical protein OXN83_03605 [Oligoflexia bacterium]|nr:hypothetical protein [Oligoflexia bacterium]